MLRVVTGRFHPELEQALLEDVHRRKASDALAPLALVVPSTSLATHLRRRLLAGGRGLLNVHVLTFHQLALRLYDEHGGAVDPPVPFQPVELLPELVFEQLVGRLAARTLDAGHPLRGATVGPGTWSTLWRTIRDLREAEVDPAVARRALEEGVFAPEDADDLEALVRLHAAFGEACRTLAAGLPDDLASAVLPWIPHSRFLTSIGHVSYHGFYDLTQVQLALLEAVVEQVPATIYFPLGEGPAYAFARRFYERHLSPFVGSSEPVLRLSAPAAPRPGRPRAEHVQLLSAVGAEGELEAAATEILALVETHGYRFDQIGVVARGLDDYLPALRRVFEDHRIPFACQGGTPLLQEPIAKVLLQLAALPVDDLPREAVLDVVTSAFRAPTPDREDVEPRPDLWRLAARSLGIMRGEADWRKLEGVGGDGEAMVPPPQVRLLWRAVQGLLSGVRALPLEGTAAELTDAFLALARRQLRLQGPAEEGGSPDPRGRAVGLAVDEVLATLRRLDVLGECWSYGAWLAALTRALERTTVPVTEDDAAGVQVLDAMAARGLSFDALLVMGLNDTVFPRAIREDPFLRDRPRRRLGETLGYKVDEKLNAFEEEQLLFTLLTQAAGRRLWLSYRRADDEGRVLAPSAYLADVVDPRDRELRVPRRLADRAATPLCPPSQASSRELALRAVLAGDDPSPWLAAVGGDATLFRHGWRAQRQLEARGRAGGYDGLTGRLDPHWERVRARGVAPTSLEQYVTCPFRYFGAQVLRLEDLRSAVPEELPGQAWGTLMHAVLRACYPALADRGWPEQDIADDLLAQLVESASAGVFEAYARHHGTGLPLLWGMARDHVRALVTQVVRADGEELRQTGFRPEAFEVEGSGRLDVLEEGADGVLVRGRVDRVDRRRTPAGLRVVDYKYKQRRDLRRRDRDLLTSAVRGLRLQPPLYALLDLSPQPPGRAGQVDFLYVVARGETVVQRVTLDGSVWGGATGAQLRRTLRLVLEGIRDGRFFILPDDGWDENYCDTCEFANACRRTHGPTWLRARAAPPSRALRAARRQKASHATGDHDS